MSRNLPADWPQPDAIALETSARLEQYVQTLVADNAGWLSFADFMQAVLYTPGLGYYVAGARKFGVDGDFVTAPERSAFFSQCLANQAQQVLATLGGGDILEFGPGSGRMALDVLSHLARLDALPETYFCVELSPELRQRQQALFAEQAPHLLEKVQWLDALPARFTGVVLANEVLDAMPVTCFTQRAQGVFERGVTYAKGDWHWQERPADSTLSDTVAHLLTATPTPYASEYNAQLRPWLSSLEAMLERGVALLIDYGYVRSEYYLPQRNGGTLLCHYRHRAHDDPFVLPGLQDITANVDFTAVAEAAVDNDLSVLGYTSQAMFLLGNGLEGLFQDRLLDSALTVEQQARLSQEIKWLTLPAEMGERFQVMAVGKDFDQPLKGFAFKDYRGRL